MAIGDSQHLVAERLWSVANAIDSVVHADTEYHRRILEVCLRNLGHNGEIRIRLPKGTPTFLRSLCAAAIKGTLKDDDLSQLTRRKESVEWVRQIAVREEVLAVQGGLPTAEQVDIWRQILDDLDHHDASHGDLFRPSANASYEKMRERIRSLPENDYLRHLIGFDAAEAYGRTEQSFRNLYGQPSQKLDLAIQIGGSSLSANGPPVEETPSPEASSARSPEISKSPRDRYSPTSSARGREHENEYIFRRNGDTWEVAFEGGAQQGLNDWVGMRYIHRLLAQPNPSRAIPAQVLSQPETESAQLQRRTDLSIPDQAEIGDVPALELSKGPGSDRCSDASDPEALRDYHARLTEIGEEQEEARTMGNMVRMEELEEEKQRIRDRVRADTGLGGKPRKLGTTETRRAADTAKKAIDRAVDHLKSRDLPGIADHLKRNIRREENGFAYRCENPPDWVL